MKKQDTNECYETETETCSTTKKSKLTTVKTIYARAAVVLLALNFCPTGYVVWQMNMTTQAQIDNITGAPMSAETTPQGATTTPRTAESQTEQEGATPSPVTTRDQ